MNITEFCSVFSKISLSPKHTQSSLTMLATKLGDGSYHHVDGGVAPDVAVSEENIFDRLYLG